MSQTLINNLFRYIESSDWNALNEVFHVDIVYERPGYAPFVGIKNVNEFYQRRRIIASGRHFIEGLVIQENIGACWGEFVGVLKNGAQVKERFADAYMFKDNRIIKRRSHFFKSCI